MNKSDNQKKKKTVQEIVTKLFTPFFNVSLNSNYFDSHHLIPDWLMHD